MTPREQVYLTRNIAAALRGAAAAFDAGRPDVVDTETCLIAVGFYAALDAMGKILDVGDWREENRDDKRA